MISLNASQLILPHLGSVHRLRMFCYQFEVVPFPLRFDFLQFVSFSLSQQTLQLLSRLLSSLAFTFFIAASTRFLFSWRCTDSPAFTSFPYLIHHCCNRRPSQANTYVRAYQVQNPFQHLPKPSCFLQFSVVNISFLELGGKKGGMVMKHISCA